MKSSADSFDRILASLHEAALDVTRWPDAERLIGEIGGSRGSGLAIFDGKSQANGTAFLVRICLDGRRRRDWERRYFEDYYAGDERVPRVLRQQYGRIRRMQSLFSDAEKRTSPTYNELLADLKAQNGLIMRLENPDGPPVIWGVCDSRDPSGWRTEQIRLIRRLQPHIRQFALVSRALAEAEVVGKSTAQLFATPRFGVIHLDRRGRIMTANDRALEILRRGDGLLDLDGFLRAAEPEEDAELSRALSRALPPFGVQGTAGSTTVHRVSPSGAPVRRLVLHITPVGEDYPHFRTRRFGAVVMIVDPAGQHRLDAAHVAAALGLTLTESELAIALATGQTVRDIAEATERSEDTVRWHLKRIYRKHGISRQVDLVRRILSVEGFGAGPRHR